MTADATSSSHELDILRSLAKRYNGSLSSQYIVQILDDFLHSGPNGTQQCLIFELLGPTLDMVTSDYSDYNDPKPRLEPDTVLRFSQQLLNAIAFVHKAGYGHGGTTSHETLADVTTKFPLCPAADVWQMLAAETFVLLVVVCRK